MIKIKILMHCWQRYTSREMYLNSGLMKNWMECAKFRMVKNFIFAAENLFAIQTGSQKVFLNS